MAQKKTEKARINYTADERKQLLAKWDGTTAGAKALGASQRTMMGWRDGETATAKKPAKANAGPKSKKPPKTTALDDALELLLGTVHVGRLKNLAKEEYGVELKRVRILQRIVAKAVAEGNAPPGMARSLAKHFDALIEGL
jgi:hypothetical protein